MTPTLFRRPLRRDPILVVWALVDLVIAAVTLNRHTEWRGTFKWELAYGFVREFTFWLLISFLVLAVLPAWFRRHQARVGVATTHRLPARLFGRGRSPRPAAEAPAPTRDRVVLVPVSIPAPCVHVTAAPSVQLGSRVQVTDGRRELADVLDELAVARREYIAALVPTPTAASSGPTGSGR